MTVKPRTAKKSTGPEYSSTVQLALSHVNWTCHCIH